MTQLAQRRGVLLMIWLVGAAALTCWYVLVFCPQRAALEGIRDRTFAELREADQIRATLRQVGAIRRARTDVTARLKRESTSDRRTLSHVLLLLDRIARDQNVSIVSIAPVASLLPRDAKSAAISGGPDLTITIEGRFEDTMRFVAQASAGDGLLDIGDVRLNAERHDGNHELLLAQIDARTYRFALPR